MPHILVVDDDAALRRVMVRMLRSLGHTVSVAKDGRLGMAEFRQQRCDLVVTDIVMPDSEGIELIRHIRSEPPPQCLVLAISGAFTAEFYLLWRDKLDGKAATIRMRSPVSRRRHDRRVVIVAQEGPRHFDCSGATIK